MARNRTFVPADPARVWAVLADANRYADWVVGSHSIRDADAAFPAAGTRFHHRVGVGPLTLSDHTEVLESEPPRRLVLHAKARPLGTARITLELVGHDGGTQLTMVEEPGDRLSGLLHNRILDRLVELRNAEALRRLCRLAADDG